jgi:hypothetical protein
MLLSYFDCLDNAKPLPMLTFCHHNRKEAAPPLSANRFVETINSKFDFLIEKEKRK